MAEFTDCCEFNQMSGLFNQVLTQGILWLLAIFGMLLEPKNNRTTKKTKISSPALIPSNSNSWRLKYIRR